MTARTTGPGRTPGSGGTPKRPTKRPAAGRPAGAKTAKDNPAGLTVVDGTAALKAVPADDETPVVEAVEAEVVEAEVVEDAAPEAEAAPTLVEVEETGTDQTDEVTETEEPEQAAAADEPVEAATEAPADDADVVIDLIALENDTDTETDSQTDTDDEAPVAAAADPAGVPPIDANVLLRAILTPPAGIANGESLTDALTGAVPTWRLDEEPIYLETIRDLGVPAVPEADGGTGEVIVGEIVEQEA